MKNELGPQTLFRLVTGCVLAAGLWGASRGGFAQQAPPLEQRVLAPLSGADAAPDSGEQPVAAFPAPNGKNAAPPLNLANWAGFLKGWQGFLDSSPLEFLVSCLLAIFLASFIAYHPRSFGKASTLEELEQPKLFLMYALVGSMVGLICGVSQAMAFVIFGLGGLFRFRTDAGPARDTGRLILVTLVGILCGLMQFVPAVVSTVLGWGLIFFLESRAAHRMVIKGLEEASLAQSAGAYKDVLTSHNFAVMSEKKNFLKKQVVFVFRTPGRIDREQIEGFFQAIPEKLRGAIDWEST